MDYGSHKNEKGYSSTAKEFIQAQSEAAIARTLGTVKPSKTHAKTARPATSNYIGSHLRCWQDLQKELQSS